MTNIERISAYDERGQKLQAPASIFESGSKRLMSKDATADSFTVNYIVDNSGHMHLVPVPHEEVLRKMGKWFGRPVRAEDVEHSGKLLVRYDGDVEHTPKSATFISQPPLEKEDTVRLHEKVKEWVGKTPLGTMLKKEGIGVDVKLKGTESLERLVRGSEQARKRPPMRKVPPERRRF